METAVLSAVVSTLGTKLFAFLQENHDLRRNLERDIQYIRNELRMISAAIAENERRRSCQCHGGSDDGDYDAVQRAWIHGARELACDMDDCIDRFMYRANAGGGRGLGTLLVRTKFATEIRELKKKSEDLSKLRASYTSPTTGGAAEPTTCTGGASTSTTTFSACETHAPAADVVPVGMDGPRDEILELIREEEAHGQQPKQQLKVISLVGFGGIGKTLLAMQVYQSAAFGEEIQARAWVSAVGKSAGDVLKEMQRQLLPQDVVHCDVSKLVTSLKKLLDSKRFFIVIDDMQTEYWNSTIKDAFPVDTGLSSIVMVTTAIQSIANACSSGRNGHVYMMRTLGRAHSRELFLREGSWEDYPSGSETAVNAKCDGLPLALVTTAQFLQSRGHQQRPAEIARLCDNLGMHLETEDTLARMNHVLVHNYTNLPGHVTRACLLYFGIFPSGHPVRRGKLIRRWSAEGLAEADHRRSSLDVANDSFEELVNRSVVQPVTVSSNTEVKTCQTHGMMLEFILRKSMSDNFITLLHDQARLPDKIRCLSVQHSSGKRGRMNLDMDLSLVRSLTIFGNADEFVLEFSRYELVRVLDLEECENLRDEHLSKICNLSLLKYLSLGPAVTTLPEEIAKLKFLETLDVRRTRIKIVPVQVIKLPFLTHLFGVLKLQVQGQRMSNLQKYLSKKSKLETLAGFVTDRDKGFPQLINHMNNLARVKIWCENISDPGISNIVHLSKAIQGFIQRGTNPNDARSISLNFGECFQEHFLNFSLDDSCYLTSLKLKGKIGRLPPFVTTLAVLTELCLSSSDYQLSGDVLAAISNIRSLQYLKLIARHLDRLVIGQKALRSLRRLCIMVESMAQPEIQHGALPNLESIRLLCKDLEGLSGISIQYLGLGCLREVILDNRLREETKEEWKRAGKSHPRRPKVSFVTAVQVVGQQQVQDKGADRPAENDAAQDTWRPASERQLHGSLQEDYYVLPRRLMGL